MAYKNQKKNKKHSAELRKKHGLDRKKSERRRELSKTPLTQEAIERIIRKEGLI